MNNLDIIIIGCGPAGMTAAIYATKPNKQVAIIEKNAPGGKMLTTNHIENYPGKKLIDGVSLSMEMFEHMSTLPIKYIPENVIDIHVENDIKTVITNKNQYQAKVVIIATGIREKRIGIKGEEEYYSKGVSYCATCDASLFKDKYVAVIGNTEHAKEEAKYLEAYAKEVTLIEDYTTVEEIMGDGNKVVALKLKDQTLQVDGVFPFIGNEPGSMFTKRLNIVDDKGYIVTNEQMETSIPGIFAIGDVKQKELRQIVTACSDGAIAGINALKYLSRK